MLTLQAIQNAVDLVVPVYPIRRIDLFGSYADGTCNDSSDIDLLVEFQTSFVSLITIAGLKLKLEELTGAEVDIVHAPVEDDSFLEIGKVVPLYES